MLSPGFRVAKCPANPENLPMTVSLHRFRPGFALLVTFCWLHCVTGFSAAAEPGKSAGWLNKQFAAWPSPVDPGAVIIEGETDIRWMPQPFVFSPGDSVRYVDWEGGRDDNSGLARDAAWKHHPWDAQATGKAAAEQGVHAYVFKGGVIYRGNLVGKESGTSGKPIRLTRDPAWGDGPATIAGSEAIGGWTKLSADDAKAAGLPDASGGKVWTAEVPGDFIPRALWLLAPDGERSRLPLARWPNWKIEDPYKHFTQWFRVEKVEAPGMPRATIFAPKVLNDPDPDAYKGATVWVDHPVVSGEFTIMGPFPSSIGKYDPEKGSIQPELNHPVRHPAVNSPFYLENLPRFLDEAGEWYFDAKSRQLYAWLPSEADPNRAIVEVARHENIIDLVGVSHVEISGLLLTGGNCLDLNKAPEVGGYDRPMANTQMSAIRLSGACQDITLRHLEIRDTAGTGICNALTAKDDLVRGIRITDNRLANIDNDAIELNRGTMWRKAETNPKGRLTDLEIYRNHISDVGFRNSVEQGGRGIDLMGPEVADIAGNVIERVAAQGININGGRPFGGMLGASAPGTPLIRIQVRQNKVEETVMYKSDFGNIEYWGPGPVYMYNNLSITPVGLVPNRGNFHKNHAFYFDHGIKGYLFNNIGWSARREDAHLGVVGDNFFQEIRNRWNILFQNTAYDYRKFASHESSYGDQQYYLGNIALNMRSSFLSYSRLGEASAIGYANNVFGGKHESFYSRYRGEKFDTIEELRRFMDGFGNHVTKDIGVVTDVSPVVDAEKHDFRPTDTSAAIDRGVSVFVPWSLYGNVGEWYFRLEPRQPNIVLGSDLYPQDFYSDGGMVQIGGVMPGNDLEGEGFTAEDYSTGVLENWNQGALAFNGKKVLRLPNARLIQDFELTTKKKEKIPISGERRETVRMDTNNFLIETVFRAEPGATGGLIASKLADDAGYALGLDQDGHAQMTLRSGGQEMSVRSDQPANDGIWHHVIAEVDRAARSLTLYLDGGKLAGAINGDLLAPDASLDNTADFTVGEGFHGQLDYLRVNRGTLADAQTTIGELMSWQFNGPSRHDFAGQAKHGDARDSGAIENMSATGLQTVSYTPRKSAPAAEPAEKSGDAFLDGPDRTVKSLEWGAVSVPKAAKAGESVDIQVALVTETIERTGFVLKVDLHGTVDGQRVTGLTEGGKMPLTPGKTTPYTVNFKVPARDGLSRVVAAVYISTDGTWATKTINTEVAFDVVK